MYVFRAISGPTFLRGRQVSSVNERQSAMTNFLGKVTLIRRVAATTTAFANLLVDGSAETGDIVPWVATANGSGLTDADAADAIRSVDIAQDAKPLSAFDGTRLFSFSESGANDAGNRFIMTRTGALSGGAAVLTLGGVFATEFEDFGTAALGFHDAASALLAEISTPSICTMTSPGHHSH